MIPQDTIQQILQAADVVDVVGDFVSLKKRGANMIACCPFHNEKTPSFSVSATKQIYKCFGCGKGGDAVRFIMDLEGLSYPEALKWLAKKYGIEIKEKEYTDEELLAQNERDSLFIVTEFAQKYYAEQLKSEEGRSIGYSYFKERGYNDATIEKFGLGYSPDSWGMFTKHALKKGFSLPILEKAGLTIIKEGKDPIDRFRGRVVFPINNVAGKPIAFGARILKANPKSPKYLNSPETDIYHKSRIVYGIYTAKNGIRNEDNCYLVEGYTDVVSLNQAGIENVVASSGTSLTKEQIQLIRRFSTNITVLYDGDAAGINASLRGTDIILEEGLNVRVVVFPDGEDPDSFVQSVGSDAFKTYVKEKSKDFIRFKTEISLERVGNDPVAKAGLITELVETITKIPDAIKRAVFYKEVATLLQIDEAVLINEGNKLLRKSTSDKNRSNNRFQPPPSDGDLPPDDFFLGPPDEASGSPVNKEEQSLLSGISYKEELFVKDLVCYGSAVIEKDEETGEEVRLADYVLHEIGEAKFQSVQLNKILELYRDEYEAGRLPETSFFTSHPDEQVQKKVVDWLSPPYELSESWKKYEIFIPNYIDSLDDLSYRNILRIKKERFEGDYMKLIEKLSSIEDADEQEELLLQAMKIKKLVQKLADQLGSVI
ncbi:DNA primase [Arcticibacterium luteifluviistationis]|uniref:DNA primase n=1 Tax=Arcticibacterium luteifluviistationis TaxID=1784714 RepID=A0A2Z4GB12_9BACT|nr:DNA primase [Arcticibacterium luteifluviistationis]AWV98123.1 DNA primase [Arcticibacterium luteifluviistationis]